MSVKVVIFDFDGTIADTLDAIVTIANRLSTEFGYRPATQEDIYKLKNLTSNQIIKTAQVRQSQLPLLIHKVKTELGKEISNLSPIEGITPVLSVLQSRGYKLGIITGNATKNVMNFLNNNSIGELFDFVYSGTGLFGKDKVINAYLNKEDVLPKDVIYVGDETRDIEAAKKIPVKVIAVSWGFNSKQVLLEHRPDFLIDQPQELLSILEGLS